MKLKVGDKVKILDINKIKTSSVGASSFMCKYIEGITYVTECYISYGGGEYYNLNVDGGRWNWDMNWLEKAK